MSTSRNAFGWVLQSSVYPAPTGRRVSSPAALAAYTAELDVWQDLTPLLSLDELDDRMLAAVTGRLWEARLHPRAGDPVELAQAVAVVQHLLGHSTPDALQRNQPAVRRLVGALDVTQRADLLATLGPAGGLRRRFVERLARDDSPVARAYAA